MGETFTNFFGQSAKAIFGEKFVRVTEKQTNVSANYLVDLHRNHFQSNSKEYSIMENHSAEVAFALHTQRPRVRTSAFTRSKFIVLPRFNDSSALGH